MKRLKQAFIFCSLILIILSFTSSDPHENLIIEGHSIGRIKLGMTTFQVDSILKSKSKKIVWDNYSFEFRYEKEGISIWVLQNDSSQQVFSITAYPQKWKGETSNGLKINKRLKVKNVIDLYGSPEWGYTFDCSELEAEYESFGIYFSVDTLSGFCDETEINHDSLFFNSKVTEVTISKVVNF